MENSWQIAYVAITRWLIIVVFFASAAQAQIGYTGYLGSQPIHLVAYVYGDGVVTALYVYDKYDSPIKVDGRLADSVLELQEKDADQHILAALTFDAFNKTQPELTGEWRDKSSSKRLPITLKKEFEIELREDRVAPSIELLQVASTREHYFKTVVVKEKDQFYPRVGAIKIFEKGSDKLMQTFELDAELRGIESVSIGDYNFDGNNDFSLFEASYAGPNTSSIYFLKIAGSNKYFRSDFTGTSLEFNPSEKLIYEHNQCCAGRSHMNATYKIVDNKMVLLTRKCLEIVGEEGDVEEVQCD